MNVGVRDSIIVITDEINNTSVLINTELGISHGIAQVVVPIQEVGLETPFGLAMINDCAVDTTATPHKKSG